MKLWIDRSLKILYGYIAIAGLITFSLFICEEAIQTVMFGTWPAKDIGDWAHVKRGAELMEKTNQVMRAMSWLALIQPLAFISYRGYADSTDYYIHSLRAEALGAAPDLFLGDMVAADIMVTQFTPMPDGRHLAVGGRLGFITDAPPSFGYHFVSGTLVKQGGRFIIEVD